MGRKTVPLNLKDARRTLEHLYLSGPGEYELQFPESMRRQIDLMFDDIIYRYGIRPVRFTYCIVPEDSEYLIKKVA